MNRQNRQNRRDRNEQRKTKSSASGPHVPTTADVVPGAAVSIVLKADQPTGRQVQGIVKDLLTRGDHPRGIKVRLQDGRIGRVQRMGTGTGVSPHQDTQAAQPTSQNHRQGWERADEFEQGPPPRTLADFLPPDSPQYAENETNKSDHAREATVKCPFCETFEGDEIAVSRHVEEHLT